MRALLDEDLNLRLVVPTTLIDEIQLYCHHSMKGGHQWIVWTFHLVKSGYNCTGTYSNVTKYIQACDNFSTSMSTPHLRENSPDNVVAGLPFQVVSMDFVIHLTITR